MPIVFVAGLSSCNDETATPEACVERFTKTWSSSLLDTDGKLEPIFTYDISETEGFLDELGVNGLDGVKMTFADGVSGPAYDAFLQDDPPEKGALFSGGNTSLFRVEGKAGSQNQTIVAGCEGGPEKSRLIRIDWTMIPPETGN